MTDSLRHDSVQSFTAAFEALKISEEISYDKGVANSRLSIGVLYFLSGDLINSRFFLEDAIDRARETDDSLTLARGLRILGIVYEERTEFAKAVEYIGEASAIYTRLNNESGMADCFISLGVIHQRQSDDKEASEYYHNALNISERQGNRRQMSALYNNLAALYNAKQAHDSAKLYYRKAYELAEHSGDLMSMRKAKANMGNTYLQQGQYRKAIDLISVAFEIVKESRPNYGSSIYYFNLARSYAGLKMYDSANYYLEIIRSLAEEQNSFYDLSEYHQLNAEILRQQGKLDKAYVHLQNYTRLRDSLNKELYTEKYAEMEAMLEMQNKERENIELRKNQKEQAKMLNERDQNILVLAGTLLLILILLVIIILNRSAIRKNKDLLEEKNREIEVKRMELMFKNEKLLSVLAEKDELIGMLAHDLRAPFGKIQNLAALGIEEGNPAELSEYMQYIERISKEGLSLIKETIEMSRVSAFEENEGLLNKLESFDITELMEEMVNSFKVSAEMKEINIQIFGEKDPILLYSKKDLLKRILDNLIGNAIKFSPRNAKVEISCCRYAEDVMIEIKDGGPGFTPADIKKLFSKFQKLSAKPTGAEVSSGMGLYISKQLVQILGGDLTLTSRAGESACFELRVPLNLEFYLKRHELQAAKA